MYAVGSDGNGVAWYSMSRVAPPFSTYVIDVPPGYYSVIARRDADPLSVAGHTYNVDCTSTAYPCDGSDHSLVRVRVDSTKLAAGVDLGDWNTEASERTAWEIDTGGSPLPLLPDATPSASPSPAPWETVPSTQVDASLTVQIDTRLGASLALPAGWHELRHPFLESEYYDSYYTNEAVLSPLELDSKGLFLTVRWTGSKVCPAPDWTLVTARIQVAVQGAQVFYLEGRPPGAGAGQPFTDYSLVGGAVTFGFCLEFLFTATTQATLESNLPALVAALQQAQFKKPF